MPPRAAALAALAALAVAPALLAAPSRAAADDLAGTPTDDELELVPSAWVYGASAEAGTRTDRDDTGTRTVGELAIGASLRYVPEVGCTVLDARQELRWVLRGDAATGEGFAPDGTLEICLERAQLAEDRWIPTVAAGYRLATDAVPRLDAAPTVAPAAYTLYTAHFDVGFLDTALAGGRLTGARLGARADLLLQGAGATATEPTQGLGTLSFLAARHAAASGDRALEIGALRWRFETADHAAHILDLVPLAGHARLGDRVTLDGALGYGIADRGDRRRRTALGRLALHAAFGPATATLAAERGFLAGARQALLLEDRVTAGLATAVGRHAAELGGFVARTELVDGGAPRELTAGASLDYRLDLGRFVTWRASAEAGRSFFARLGGVEVGAAAGIGAPRLGFQLSTAIELHADHARPAAR